MLLSAVARAAGAASPGGTADAFPAGLFGTVDSVSGTAQDGGEDEGDKQIHVTFFLSFCGRP